MIKNTLLLLFFTVYSCCLAQAQEIPVLATPWQDAPPRNCFTAQYNAPIGSILEIKYQLQTVFVEVIKQNNSPQDQTLSLNPCVWSMWSKISQEAASSKSVNVSVKIHDKPKQGLTVNNPALTDFSTDDTDLGFTENTDYTTRSFDENPFANLSSTSNQGFQANQTPQVTNGLQAITEQGFADASNISSNNPFTALHRTAPIGTLINIKHLINDNACVAEVVANINPITAKAGVIIEVSPTVFARLGAETEQLIEVELSYLGFPPATNTEKVRLTSFESAYLSTERVALHPSLPLGTIVRLEGEGTFTVMGKSTQANTLQIPSAIYKNLQNKSTTTVWNLAYSKDLEADKRLVNNFKQNSNISEEALGTAYQGKSIEKMAVWHKTIPVGTTLLVERVLYKDEDKTEVSQHLLKVVGKLDASQKATMQISSDAWQLLQKPNSTNHFISVSGFGSLDSNSSTTYTAPANPEKISVFIYYFAL